MEISDNIESPVVSIIMNCYNCSTYLKEAIDSVYTQTYGDWEIIFWDNVSTDNSAEIAKNYDSKLRYFCGDKNVPLGNARNLAIEKAQGQYIAFLDCDDIWLPSKLEKQISLFEANSNIKLVFSDCNVINSQHEILYRLFSVQKPSRGFAFNELLLSNNFISLVTVVIERSVFYDIGTFNDEFKIAEEYDLFLRIAHKHPLDYVDEALAEYRIHENNWSHRQDIGIKEQLKIIEFWLNKDILIKNKLRTKKIKRKIALCLYYIVKYMKFPKKWSAFYKTQ
ncbi:glycosyltransferase [Methanolobus sp.]|jgi:glycosyltransferase involved in cell wall biosynthesis|uniref:glycosyltransferase family 2 protein n=1 Tax=Methanolobus sp. TaxID=1874737 RepID=UPI0025F03F6D|nr:glycosyltransferase [Methanolobus sp.]